MVSQGTVRLLSKSRAQTPLESSSTLGDGAGAGAGDKAGKKKPHRFIS